MYAALSFNSSDNSFVGYSRITGWNLGDLLRVTWRFWNFVLFLFSSQMKAVLSNLDLLVEHAKWWNFQYLQAIECYKFIMHNTKKGRPL
jgi:hypothetical protein